MLRVGRRHPSVYIPFAGADRPDVRCLVRWSKLRAEAVKLREWLSGEEAQAFLVNEIRASPVLLPPHEPVLMRVLFFHRASSGQEWYSAFSWAVLAQPVTLSIPGKEP